VKLLDKCKNIQIKKINKCREKRMGYAPQNYILGKYSEEKILKKNWRKDQQADVPK